MDAVSHKIDHQYQPTPTTCSQTAFSILLGHYNTNIPPLEAEQQVPQVKDSAGNDSGTITQQLAAWASGNGFNVTVHTFDSQIIDQSWSELTKDQIIAKLNSSLDDGWVVPGLGKEWSRAYRQSYIDLLEADCKLVIQPSVTTKLLYTLLEDNPIFATIGINTLYGRGRTLDGDLGYDDIHGRTWNHSIVIYGNDEAGNFFIADPIVKPGLHVVEPERMIAAVTAAQVECDNLLFHLVPH